MTQVVELHTHPLVHKYYAITGRPVILDSNDKKGIARMIDWAISLGIQVFCPCDHDTVESSIWAKEYVRSKGLPIKIVIGTEVSTWEPLVRKEIHIGAYGILTAPPMGKPVKETLDNIHSQGGIAILNHPQRIEDDKLVYHLLHSGYFDGVEIYNHTNELIGIEQEINQMVADGVRSNILGGDGIFYPDYLKELNLLQLSGSDNHNAYEQFEYYPYTPGTISSEWVNKIYKEI